MPAQRSQILGKNQVWTTRVPGIQELEKSPIEFCWYRLPAFERCMFEGICINRNSIRLYKELIWRCVYSNIHEDASDFYQTFTLQRCQKTLQQWVNGIIHFLWRKPIFNLHNPRVVPWFSSRAYPRNTILEALARKLVRPQPPSQALLRRDSRGESNSAEVRKKHLII